MIPMSMVEPTSKFARGVRKTQHQNLEFGHHTLSNNFKKKLAKKYINIKEG
jgi:hypothetical protein